MSVVLFFLGLCALVAALVLVILLIVFAVQKRALKTIGIATASTFAAAVILMAVAIALPSSSETQEVTNTQQVTSGDVQPETKKSVSTPKQNQTPKPTPTPKDNSLSLGDTFTFDQLEITLGTEISWDTVQNQFSDLNGRDVICVPVTIKNISDETHSLNMFYYTLYGSKGTELDSVDAYFDNNAGWAGDMRSGGVQNVYFHMLYDGDGDYYIEFDNYTTKLEVKIPITK